jgi:flagellar hook-basal body complex protein FliE
MIAAIGDLTRAGSLSSALQASLVGMGKSAQSAEAAVRPPTGFGEVLQQLADDAANALRAGEAAAVSGVQGKLATQDVVEAVMAAEHTLQTAVAVRDKVVSAYLEISRMAI